MTTLVVILAIVLFAVGGIGVATNGNFDIMSLLSSPTTSSGQQAASPPPSTPSDEQTNSSPDQSTPATPTVSADELITEYKTDQAAAAAKYKGKTFTVTGKVAAYALSEYSVTLKGDTAADFGIKCMFSEGDVSSISSLNLDQEVKVTGTVGDLKTGDITITDCSFVK